jgi:hypothetical protein
MTPCSLVAIHRSFLTPFPRLPLFCCWQRNNTTRDFRLPPPCWWDLCSSGMLRSVEW